MPASLPARFLRFIALALLAGMLSGAALPALAQSTLAEPADEAGSDPQRALVQLIEILRDDAAREALIAELEASTAPAGAEGTAEADAPSDATDELRSIGGQIADVTRDAVQGISNSLDQLWRQLSNTPRIFSALSISQLDALWAIATSVAILAVVTYGGWWLMRRLINGSRTRLSAMFLKGSWIAKPVAVILELVLDIVAAVVPYASGYVIAVGLLGEPGVIRLEHSLYLNAFLMVEVVLSLLRRVVSPAASEQRLVHVTDPGARAVMAWGRVLVSLFVFGQMLILPLITTNVSFVAGRAISIVLVLITLATAAAAVLAARRPVQQRLKAMVENREARKGLSLPIRYWHVLALIYLAVLAVVALTRTSAQFQAYLWSNAQIALTILVGFIIVNIIKRILGNGVTLPEDLRRRSPELQRQINAIAPAVLRVARFVVIVAVVVYCLHGLGLFNAVAFIESEIGAQMAGSTVTILVILALAVAAWIGIHTWVDGQVNPELAPRATARKRTLLVLMRNAMTIAIVVISLMFILSEVGINIAPLIASAGVIGLAIGFGAQKLVQDIITGIFIQFEGAIDVGDVVSVSNISGVVERLTIRSVSLRDVEGSYHIIPFSSVDTVTNFMRGFSYALIDLGVAYREDANYVKQAMFDAFETLKADPQQARNVVGDFEWFGVNEFGASEVIFRGRIKTLPGQQWGVKRAYNGIVKRILDERGIEIPYPHQTLYFGEDKLGNAPPVRVVTQDAHEATQGQGTAPAPVLQTDDGIEVPEPSRAVRRKARRSGTATSDPVENQLPDVDAGPDGAEDK